MEWKNKSPRFKGFLIGLFVMIALDVIGIILYISTLPGCSGNDCVLNQLILIVIPAILFLIIPVIGFVIGLIIGRANPKK